MRRKKERELGKEQYKMNRVFTKKVRKGTRQEKLRNRREKWKEIEKKRS